MARGVLREALVGGTMRNAAVVSTKVGSVTIRILDLGVRLGRSKTGKSVTVAHLNTNVGGVTINLNAFVPDQEVKEDEGYGCVLKRKGSVLDITMPDLTTSKGRSSTGKSKRICHTKVLIGEVLVQVSGTRV